MMLNLLMNRRTIRKYKNQEIDKETLDQIIKAALASPSGKNIRPWQLIVVKDKKTLEQLGKVRGDISAPIAGAGVGIVIIADPDLTDTWVEDTSIMATIIQLMSQSLGLGSCWLQIRGRVTESKEVVEHLVKDILKIPENFRVECMLSIGYPNEERSPHAEDALDHNKVHYDHF